MPVKKPRLSADDEFDAAPYTTRKLAQNLGVEDLNLPRSMVGRLAKGVLPPNTQVQKDAMLAISKSATVFVNYLASHANDRATLNNKKTIQPEDVFEALKELEFEDMIERCQEEEKRFAAMLNNKRNDYRRRVKEQKAETEKDTMGIENGANGAMTNGHTDVTEDGPATKKPRLSAGVEVEPNDASLMNDVTESDDTVDENDDNEDEDEADDDENDSLPSNEEEDHGLKDGIGDQNHDVDEQEASDSD